MLADVRELRYADVRAHDHLPGEESSGKDEAAKLGKHAGGWKSNGDA